MKTIRILVLAVSFALPALAASQPAYVLTPDDKSFLDDLERRNYRYFEEAAHPQSGLIADRHRVDNSDVFKASSVAATGFGLTAHSIAASRGWISRDEAVSRCLRILTFMREKGQHEHGFFYQYLDMQSGRRDGKAPASSIDQALFLAGALTAAAAFPDSDIPALAEELYDRTDWKWMCHRDDFICHGWTPEEGFLRARWDSYSELMIMLILATGSDTHPMDRYTWEAWGRLPVREFNGEKYINCPPLFVHQYSHGYFDFRKWNDGVWDYWRNSQVSTLAQIDYMTRLAAKYPGQLGHYSEDLWGLTPSDGPHDYMDWGAPYPDDRLLPWRGIDGTLVPSAPGGSLAICPEPCLRTLRYQKERFGDKIYGRYGFANAHNPNSDWVSSYCLAIDTGITLLMAENLRSEFVWNTFMSHPVAKRAINRIQFKPVSTHP
jgi:hypothetical protein